MVVGRTTFPFGARPIFRGKLAASFPWCKSDWTSSRFMDGHKIKILRNCWRKGVTSTYQVKSSRYRKVLVGGWEPHKKTITNKICKTCVGRTWCRCSHIIPTRYDIPIIFPTTEIYGTPSVDVWFDDYLATIRTPLGWIYIMKLVDTKHMFLAINSPEESNNHLKWLLDVWCTRWTPTSPIIGHINT